MGILEFFKIGKQAGDALASPIDAIGNAIDKTFTNDEEKMQARTTLEKMRQKPQILQAEINKLDAQSRFWFQSGWRPWIGWVLGTSLALFYIPQFALAAFIWAKMCLAANEILAYPIDSIAGLVELVLAMLGLGAMRTAEKFGGKAK